MGCNCATQEQIKKLHQLYGEKSNLDKPFNQRVGDILKGVIIKLILFLISPILVGFIFYKLLFTKDKQISVKRILRLKGEGLDKALATNIIENTNIIDSE